MKKKFLSFFLAFILLLNLLSAGVLAAEDTSPLDILAAVQSVVTEEESTLSAEEPAPVPEEEPIPEPEAEDPAVITIEHTAVNPLYADVVDIEELSISVEAPRLGSAADTYSSIADAAVYVREQMKQRAADISQSQDQSQLHVGIANPLQKNRRVRGYKAI